MEPSVRARPLVLSRLPAAVVFDMDGLLLDTERLWMAALIETLADHGQAIDEEGYRAILGTPWPAIREHLIARYGPALAVDEVRPAWTARCVALCETDLALKSGVLELLDLIETLGIPTAVATSSPRDLAVAHLDHMGLITRFRAILAQGDYPKGKPDPAPYLAAAATLGLSANDCLALEDSHNGVRSAAGAGMMTVMVPDLLGPTDEIATLCLAVSPDLHAVRAALYSVAVERRMIA